MKPLLLALLAVLTLPLIGSAAPYRGPFESPYAPHQTGLSMRDFAEIGEERYDVPAEITMAVAIYESGGDMNHPPAKCANGTEDYGPGLNSRWLPYFSERFNGGEPIDPTSPSSLLIVAQILDWNYSVFWDWDMALTAYRWGQTGAKKHGVDGEYVRRVRAWI
jgi:hypothetical protein